MNSDIYFKVLFLIQIFFCPFFSTDAASLTLVWDENVEPVSGYRVYMREKFSGEFERIWEGSQTCCVVEETELSAGRVYVFVVRAFNRYGESGNSNPVEYIKHIPADQDSYMGYDYGGDTPDIFDPDPSNGGDIHQPPDAFLSLLNGALYVLEAGSTTQVFGNSEINNLFLKSGSKAILSSIAGKNVIYVEAASRLFEVSRSGGLVIFDGSDGTLFSVHATMIPQTIAFSDGACDLVNHGRTVMLNGRAVGTIPALIDSPMSVVPVYSEDSSLDMDHPDACLFLDNQVCYRLRENSSTEVYGSSGKNRIVVEQGAVARLFSFPGENEIFIEAESSDFTISRTGATIALRDEMGTRLMIPSTLTVQTLHFNDLSLGFCIFSGKVMLGAQEINATPAPVSGW